MRKLYWTLIFTIGLIIFASINVNAQQRIQFRRNATSASTSGKLAANQTWEFVVSARQGQLITISVKSRRDLIHFRNEAEGVYETKRTYRTQKGNNYIALQNDSSKTEIFTLIISIE